MLPIFQFKPIFKSVLWGGRRIAEFKHIPAAAEVIGESWEVSPMKGDESIVADGMFKGLSLNELCNKFADELLGTDVCEKFGNRFPLLIKFIDSTKDLSIQVHPDDEIAMRRHNSLGKTEMWYSVAPAEGAYLYAGFKHAMTPDSFMKSITDGTITDKLNRYDVKSGDVFYLPAGKVHSIGQGNLILEIQEASDITYRIYDYDRLDAQGNKRQLHIEESIEAVDYIESSQGAIHVDTTPGVLTTIVDCDYFTFKLLKLSGEYSLQLPVGKSFTVVISTKGDIEIRTADNAITLAQGHTALIPASMRNAILYGQGEIVTVNIKK